MDGLWDTSSLSGGAVGLSGLVVSGGTGFYGGGGMVSGTTFNITNDSGANSLTNDAGSNQLTTQ